MILGIEAWNGSLEKKFKGNGIGLNFTDSGK